MFDYLVPVFGLPAFVLAAVLSHLVASRRRDGHHHRVVEQGKGPLYRLPENVAVHVMTNVEECEGLLKDLLLSLKRKAQSASFIGLDCEWRPHGSHHYFEHLWTHCAAKPKGKARSQATLESGTFSASSRISSFSSSSPSSSSSSFSSTTTTITTATTTTCTTTITSQSSSTTASHTRITRNRVALLQLSNGSSCYLIRLQCLESIPPTLVQILEDPSIVKTGVGINADVKNLLLDFQLTVRGCLDLQAIAHRYGYTDSGSSLSKLSSSLLGLNVDKNHALRCSNWEAPVLSPSQIHYAAVDAFLSYKIFEEIYSRHAHASSSSLCTESDQQLLLFCANLLDRNPPKISHNPTKHISLSKGRAPKQFRSPARKTILYENCKMLAPDNTVLCTVNRKKIKWYVDRNFADLVSEDPPTIRLRFQPHGTGHADDPYYLGEKENQCVVCGAKEFFMRHSVIPYSYRKHLDVSLKSRSSHDIVLLCQVCCERANMNDISLRHQIAAETGIPLTGQGEPYFIDEKKKKIKSISKALLASQHLPAERKTLLERELYDLTLLASSDAESLAQLCNLEIKYANPSYRSHEEMVMEALKNDEQIRAFIQRWRIHFVKGLKPAFLPEHWSVTKDK